MRLFEAITEPEPEPAGFDQLEGILAHGRTARFRVRIVDEQHGSELAEAISKPDRPTLEPLPADRA